MLLEDAAGTLTAPSVGADGGGSGSPETTPSPSVVEEQPGAPPAGDETPQPEGEQPGAEAEQTIEGEPTDSRVIPPKLRELLKNEAIDSGLRKDLKAQFFENKAFKGEFPTVADARKAKQTLELVGGEAGLAEMQADNAEFTGISKDFVNGDPKFASDLFEQDSIAAAQHVPHLLEALQKYDGQAYNRLIAKQFAREFQANAINGQPLYAALENVYALVKDGKAEEALAGLNAIAGWHNRVTSLAKQEENPEVKKLREKIKADEQARSNEGQKQFLTSYRDEAQKTVRDSATNLVTQFLGSRKLDAESKNLAVHNTISLANDLLNDGKTFPQFSKQRDMLFQRGDKAALLRYVSSAWKQALDMSVKRVMRLVGGGGTAPAPKLPVGAPTRPGTNGAPRDLGFVKINERPDPRMIDRTKTTANMIASEKKAIYKDGRKVTWAHL
jgi:hypothetical protein